ncbi:MAG TPA: hypothetical protein ENF32_02580 [Thermosulfidibacter takaii]|uniref:Uncharacterized protein n=1 Tax=Thermosulfidibacter takaii TaxID=412593 RepID=A0A7C0YDH8_9BACT|nr:hypothetical protein [Thermosulfidibacter takaii]
MSKKVRLGDRDVMVKELTVAQVRQLLDEFERPGEVHVLDMMFEEAPAMALSMSTGLEVAELEEYSPSELEPLKEAFLETNPFFVRLVKRLSRIGREALKNSIEESAG